MKWIKVFFLFAVLQLVGWVGTHWYLQKNPTRILVVADTSNSLKPHFSEMERWIDDYAASCRYATIDIGTDKAMIGPLSDIKDLRSIFRTAFGRSTEESLTRYANTSADKRVLLSDGAFEPGNWELVTFN